MNILIGTIVILAGSIVAGQNVKCDCNGATQRTYIDSNVKQVVQLYQSGKSRCVLNSEVVVTIMPEIESFVNNDEVTISLVSSRKGVKQSQTYRNIREFKINQLMAVKHFETISLEITYRSTEHQKIMIEVEFIAQKKN